MAAPGIDFFSLVAAPFRMQPGLRRLPAGAPHLTPLAAGSGLWRERQRVLQAGGSRLAVTGFDERPVVAAILARAQAGGIATREPLELAFEEDFALLDGDTGTLPWLCVCNPSHWAPEDKLGLPFAAVHAPVADNAQLLKAADHLVRLATGGACWERFVWAITPSPLHDQHPRRTPRAPWPPTEDPQAFAAGCWFRSERQTFFPLDDGSRRAVFTIRVMLETLPQAVNDAGKAARLHASLASMSDAVLAYKNLAAARAPLLHWLQAQQAR
jgi:hypothetical protein